MILCRKKLKLIFCFKNFWRLFFLYIYTIKKYWKCWGLTAQGLAGGRKAKRKGKWILYYIILYYILYYIYIYYLTFCNFVQTRGWFLLTVFFFLTASVEAGASKNPPASSTSASLQNFLRFANPRCLSNKIKHLTKFST